MSEGSDDPKLRQVGMTDDLGALERAARCPCPMQVTIYDDMRTVEKFHDPGCAELARIKRDSDTS